MLTNANRWSSLVFVRARSGNDVCTYLLPAPLSLVCGRSNGPKFHGHGRHIFHDGPCRHSRCCVSQTGHRVTRTWARIKTGRRIAVGGGAVGRAKFAVNNYSLSTGVSRIRRDYGRTRRKHRILREPNFALSEPVPTTVETRERADCDGRREIGDEITAGIICGSSGIFPKTTRPGVFHFFPHFSRQGENTVCRSRF